MLTFLFKNFHQELYELLNKHWVFLRAHSFNMPFLRYHNLPPSNFKKLQLWSNGYLRSKEEKHLINCLFRKWKHFFIIYLTILLIGKKLV